jgi:hypothetical protein
MHPAGVSLPAPAGGRGDRDLGRDPRAEQHGQHEQQVARGRLVGQPDPGLLGVRPAVPVE